MVFGLLFGLLTELNALSIGDKAPDFSLQDQKGSMINMADYKDNVVVLEWINPALIVLMLKDIILKEQ